MRRTRTTNPEPAESGAAGETPDLTGPRSRRQFMKLMAAGAGVVLAAPAAAAVKSAAAAKTAAKKTAPPSDLRRARTGEPSGASHPMLPAELEKQKKSTADSLKTIRGFALPVGSAPAYVFHPRVQKRRKP